MGLEDLDKIEHEIPYESRLVPTEMSKGDEFRFDRHPGKKLTTQAGSQACVFLNFEAI